MNRTPRDGFGRLPAEQGTRIIAGRPYHFWKNPQTGQVELSPGRDPLEPGTCEAVSTGLPGLRPQTCAREAGHQTVTGQDLHQSAAGIRWGDPRSRPGVLRGPNSPESPESLEVS